MYTCKLIHAVLLSCSYTCRIAVDTSKSVGESEKEARDKSIHNVPATENVACEEVAFSGDEKTDSEFTHEKTAA